VKDIIHPTVDIALRDLLSNIISYGTQSSPRGKPVTELIGNTVSFDMRYPLVAAKARKLGYRFAPAEAAWILSGDNRVDRIKQYSRFIWEFSDDGFFYSGAYGPKIVDQLTYVCDVIADDPATRQAVIDVWRPNPRAGRDIPCTLSFQFLLRDDRLHVVQSMRSSDAWLGYPYDAFNASMLAGYVMLLLRHRTNRGLSIGGLGSHTMMIGSSHLYEKDRDAAMALLQDGELLFDAPAFVPLDFDGPDSLVEHLWWLAAGGFRDTNRVSLTSGGYLIGELSQLTPVAQRP
jgi:thymidylate synthase